MRCPAGVVRDVSSFRRAAYDIEHPGTARLLMGEALDARQRSGWTREVI